MVVISLISFLSITLITASPFISYTNFFENNSHILLKFPSIYAQDDGGGVEDNGDGGGDGGGVEDNDIGNEELTKILMILAPYLLTHQQTQMMK